MARGLNNIGKKQHKTFYLKREVNLIVLLHLIVAKLHLEEFYVKGPRGLMNLGTAREE